MTHRLETLPYAYDALEPHLDRQTMELHHGKHHQTYVNNLNKLLEGQAAWQERSLEELLLRAEELPREIRQGVINNGGGVWNHNLFWRCLGPRAGGEPGGAVAEALRGAFGSIANFREQFTAAALGRFGSGWAWLVREGEGLTIVSTANQDTPLGPGRRPLLALDVWEHAYYLKYQNRRAEYIAAWWNVVDWNAVAERLRA